MDYVLIGEQLIQKRSELDSSRNIIRANEQILSQLYSSIEMRKRLWLQLRTSLSKRASLEFFFLLEHRGFEGDMQFDHSNNLLNITVFSHKSSNNRSPRDIKQLSGGEKSYVTACFLFSLWVIMNSPFFFLDEFDVFMVIFW